MVARSREQESLIQNWAAKGAMTAGAVGAVTGLAVGISAHPATAWFAVFEVGVPSFVVGGILGLVAATIATGLLARAEGEQTQRTDDRRAVPRWPDVVVAVGAVVVLYALWAMEWASKTDDLGRTTFTDGPAVLLAFAAMASLTLSLIVVVTRRRWLRWLLLATTFTAAVSAVVVALSRIAAANSAEGHGATATSYRPGAALGVVAAVVIAAFAVVGFLESYRRPHSRASTNPPAPHDPSP